MARRTRDDARPESATFRQAVKLVEILERAKTQAERKRDERTRHREAGRVPVQVWVQPDYVAEVRALEAKLQRRERRKAGTSG